MELSRQSKTWRRFVFEDLLLAFCIIIFGIFIAYKFGPAQDYLIYKNAMDAFLAGENPYLVDGFYYLPHFLFFLPVISPLLYFLFLFGVCCYAVLQVKHHFTYAAAAWVCLYTGNFDAFLLGIVASDILFQKNYEMRWAKRVAWGVCLIKPQLWLLAALKKKWYLAVGGYFVVGITASALGYIGWATFFFALIRPSIFLFIAKLYFDPPYDAEDTERT